VNVCVASTGQGGSYISVIAHHYRGYEIVWDSLLAPSIVKPTIEFVDLTGDSLPEVVYGGLLLQSMNREWAVIGWDSSSCRVLAPRLDVPTTDIHRNRLMGKRLNILTERDDGALRLQVLTGDAPEDWITITGEHRPGQRLFLYHGDIGGYLADD
jgi:hypothetical protein